MDHPRVNLHTHTRRCKHAAGTVADYCAEAEKAGIEILGFSDHSPFPDGEYAASRMDFSELPDYRREIEEARRNFPPNLTRPSRYTCPKAKKKWKTA